jgi:hypothetical protein
VLPANNAFTTVASVTVPAGSYVLEGSGRTTAGDDDVDELCELNGATSGQFSRAGNYGSLTVLSHSSVSGQTTFTLKCRQFGASDSARIEHVTLVATKVGNLHV